jgi:transketolase C-terminal domain/subunit
LEHIDNNFTNQVFGIDINQNYLNETKKRFKDKIPNLQLANIDISTKTTEKIATANLIWAALIFEYVAADKCFEFINNNIQENGFLVATIQENNGVSSISQTGVETIKTAGQIFRLISDSDLVSVADKFGFNKIDFEENILPNGKSLKTYTFEKKTTNRQHGFVASGG